jgi:pyrophosphatase PpaX
MSLLIGIIIVGSAFLTLYWIFFVQNKHNQAFKPQKEVELKAIMFDFDGVIVDSFEAWFSSINTLRQKYGKGPLTRKKYRKKAWAIPIEIVAKDLFHGQDPKKITKECMSLVAEKVSDIKLLPDAKAVLAQIKKKHKIGLVTNSYRQLISKTLKYHEIEKYFDVIVTSEDVERPKPYPDSLLDACKKIGVLPMETIYVGDTRHDYTAGRSAGCFFIGLETDGDLIISKLDDLNKLL